MVVGNKRVAVVILIAIVSAVAVAAWAISRRPAGQVLTEEEVRRLITEHPDNTSPLYDSSLIHPKIVRVVIDAYTGEEISCHAEDVE